MEWPETSIGVCCSIYTAEIVRKEAVDVEAVAVVMSGKDRQLRPVFAYAARFTLQKLSERRQLTLRLLYRGGVEGVGKGPPSVYSSKQASGSPT